MTTDSANLEALSTRQGFNSAVRYIKKTIEIRSSSGSGNLSDILRELGDEDTSGSRIGLLLRMLLVDKLGYKTASANLSVEVTDPAKLAMEFEKWKGVDLVAAYHHPELGLLIANPKVTEELASFGQLRKRKLMVIYAGLRGKETDENCQKAASLAINVFEGAKTTVPPTLTKGTFAAPVKKTAKPVKTAVKKPKTAKAAAKPETGRTAAPVITAASPQVKTISGPVKMTPRYAVVVQNELFHNGNVEAWKRIVASYKDKHPDLEVFIFYEGERILDINSLFKWGKVKHGSAIEFAVAGNEIKDVAKLQRYLAQGASHQFEAFLHGPVNTILKLF
jgi:hypothetical protein